MTNNILQMHCSILKLLGYELDTCSNKTKQSYIFRDGRKVGYLSYESNLKEEIAIEYRTERFMYFFGSNGIGTVILVSINNDKYEYRFDNNILEMENIKKSNKDDFEMIDEFSYNELGYNLLSETFKYLENISNEKKNVYRP